jgi:hypothetical protein
MFGRGNICVMSSDNVSPFLLNANSAGRRKTRSKLSALGMSDMKKIKSKLVTIVTDNVRLVGIVGTTRMLQERSGKARIERGNEKGGDATTVREQRGLATGPPQSVRRSQTQNA